MIKVSRTIRKWLRLSDQRSSFVTDNSYITKIKLDAKYWLKMSEVFRENYECIIYIDAEDEIEILLLDVAKLIKSEVYAGFISTHDVDIYVLSNKNYHKKYKINREDGFLFYRSILKIYPNPVLGKINAINCISEILEHFWNEKVPAIATCEFEKDLPNKGGYKSLNIPYPE